MCGKTNVEANYESGRQIDGLNVKKYTRYIIRKRYNLYIKSILST